MKSSLTISCGESTYGYIKWFAYTKGKRGRLSPMFKQYDHLIAWLRRNGHL